MPILCAHAFEGGVPRPGARRGPVATFLLRNDCVNTRSTLVSRDMFCVWNDTLCEGRVLSRSIAKLTGTGTDSMKYAIVALALMLGGCIWPTVRDEAPAYSWVAKRTFEASVACVTDRLDDYYRANPPGGKPIAHRLVEQRPGMIVKIVPEDYPGRHHPYFVRVMELSERETVIDLYTYPDWSEATLKILRPCL